MTRRQKFLLLYAPVTKLHLKTIERRFHSLIRTTIEKELLFEPDVETRNRKPLKRPVTFEAEWELRFGPDNRFRVFYDINIESHEVYILGSDPLLY
jgi:hypothetical protein